MKEQLQENNNVIVTKKLPFSFAKKHQILSFVKSAISIIGYIMLPFSIISAVFFLVVSEAIGIWEELV